MLRTMSLHTLTLITLRNTKQMNTSTILVLLKKYVKRISYKRFYAVNLIVIQHAIGVKFQLFQ